MGNTVPDNKNIHSYSERWRALPPIRTHTGRKKLPSSFIHIMEDTAPDNIVRTRSVHVPRDLKRPGQCQFKGKHNPELCVTIVRTSVQVDMYTSF